MSGPLTPRRPPRRSAPATCSRWAPRSQSAGTAPAGWPPAAAPGPQIQSAGHSRVAPQMAHLGPPPNHGMCKPCLRTGVNHVSGLHTAVGRGSRTMFEKGGAPPGDSSAAGPTLHAAWATGHGRAQAACFRSPRNPFVVSPSTGSGRPQGAPLPRPQAACRPYSARSVR